MLPPKSLLLSEFRAASPHTRSLHSVKQLSHMIPPKYQDGNRYGYPLVPYNGKQPEKDGSCPPGLPVQSICHDHKTSFPASGHKRHTTWLRIRLPSAIYPGEARFAILFPTSCRTLLQTAGTKVPRLYIFCLFSFSDYLFTLEINLQSNRIAT